MEKSSVEISKFLELSFTTVNTLLCRAELNKFKDGRKYKINIEFVDELYKLLEQRRKDQKHWEEKYKKAQMKLYQWRRKLTLLNNY